MAGGQPVSMRNLRETCELCRCYGIPVMLDATRALENAWFIKQRESGHHDRSVREILFEICSYSDGATVSSKKDNLVNIGGFLTQAHMDIVAESVEAVYEEREHIGGLVFTYEPAELRFFQARFEPAPVPAGRAAALRDTGEPISDKELALSGV